MHLNSDMHAKLKVYSRSIAHEDLKPKFKYIVSTVLEIKIQ